MVVMHSPMCRQIYVIGQSSPLTVRSTPGAGDDAEGTVVRIASRWIESGLIDIQLQVRNADEVWGSDGVKQRVLRFSTATATAGRWLGSEPFTVRVPQWETALATSAECEMTTTEPTPPAFILIKTTTTIRITARALDDGRTELALQQRGADGCWGERLFPGERFLPATRDVGTWLAGAPLTVRAAGADDSVRGTEVRVIGRWGADGRVEIRLQQLQAKEDWDELFPEAPYFPANTSVGLWLASEPLTVSVPEWKTPLAPSADCEDAE